MHALIVEDDRTIADFVARGLREAGFAVDVAADGEEGLSTALEHEPDVVIVDLMLPKRDGLGASPSPLPSSWPVCRRSCAARAGRPNRQPSPSAT